MKEVMSLSDADTPRQATTEDIPESWGFHLLQELRRMEDKMDAKIDGLESKMDAKIDAVELRTNARIDNLTQEVRALRYWSWGTILTVIAGAVATILMVLFH